MTTSKKGPRSLLRREIRGEWYIWNTISNTSNTRTNIRNQMTNVPSTPTRKRLTYWKRWWRLNVRKGGRRCIFLRRSWLRQRRIQLRQCHRLGVMPSVKYIKWKTRCMQNFIISEETRRASHLQAEKCMLRRKRRWLRWGDSPLKRWLRRCQIRNKSLQRWDDLPIIR